jgi:hypothetical protein
MLRAKQRTPEIITRRLKTGRIICACTQELRHRDSDETIQEVNLRSLLHTAHVALQRAATLAAVHPADGTLGTNLASAVI